MSSEVRLLRTPTFDLDYRLCRCEGFRVDSPRGRVGVVEEVRFRSRIDRPDVLAVRTGLVGGLVLIPANEVDEVSLAEERVVIRHAPERGERDLVRLRKRLAESARSWRARTGLPRW